MATINITELQMSENVGLSLNTINSNNNLLAGGINAIEKFLNTTTPNGVLTIGNIIVPTYNSGTDVISLSIGNSAEILGDKLVVNGKIEVNGTSPSQFRKTSFTGDSIFDKESGVIATCTMKQNLNIQSTLSIAGSPTSGGTIKQLSDAGSATAIAVASGINSPGLTYISIGDPNSGGNAADDSFKIGPGNEGQILFIKFTGTGAATTVKLLNDNFAAEYASEITLTATTDQTELLKASLTLLCVDGGWTLLNSQVPSSVTLTF